VVAISRIGFKQVSVWVIIYNIKWWFPGGKQEFDEMLIIKMRLKK